jgi:hypothetical protein
MQYLFFCGEKSWSIVKDSDFSQIVIPAKPVLGHIGERESRNFYFLRIGMSCLKLYCYAFFNGFCNWEGGAVSTWVQPHPSFPRPFVIPVQTGIQKAFNNPGLPPALRPLNLSFRGALATRNLNNFGLIRFLPTVEMTENRYYSKLSRIWRSRHCF